MITLKIYLVTIENEGENEKTWNRKEEPMFNTYFNII